MKKLSFILLLAMFFTAANAQVRDDVYIKGETGEIIHVQPVKRDTVYVVKEVVKDNSDDVASVAAAAILFDFVWRWDGYRYYRYPVRPYWGHSPRYYRHSHYWGGPARRPHVYHHHNYSRPVFRHHSGNARHYGRRR